MNKGSRDHVFCLYQGSHKRKIRGSKKISHYLATLKFYQGFLGKVAQSVKGLPLETEGCLLLFPLVLRPGLGNHLHYKVPVYTWIGNVATDIDTINIG